MPAPTRLTSFFDWLFGFDFFLSYSHADGVELPRALKKALDAKGFRVFLDQRGYTPGEDLLRSTVRRVKNSTSLVLIARKGSMTLSDWTVREVEISIEQGRRQIVVDIDDWFHRAEGETEAQKKRAGELRELLEGKLHIRQSTGSAPDQVFDDLLPTPYIRDELARTFDAVRQDRKRAGVFGGVALVMAGLMILSLVIFAVARNATASSRSRQIAAVGEQKLQREPARLLDAIQSGKLAVETGATFEAETLLRQALSLHRPTQPWTARAEPASGVAFSADDRIAAFSVGNALELVETGTGDGWRRVPWTPSVEGLALSNEAVFLVSFGENELSVIRVEDGEILLAQRIDGELQHFIRTDGGEALLIITTGAVAHLSFEGLEFFQYPLTEGPDPAWNPTHGRIAWLSAPGQVSVLDEGGLNVLTTSIPSPLALLLTVEDVVIRCENLLESVSLADGSVSSTFELSGEVRDQAATSRHHLVAITSGVLGQVEIYDVEDGKSWRLFQGAEGMAFDSDSGALAVKSSRGILVFDPESEAVKGTVGLDWPHLMAFGLAGGFATADFDVIRVWDRSHYQTQPDSTFSGEVARIPIPGDLAEEIEFSPGGRWLVVKSTTSDGPTVVTVHDLHLGEGAGGWNHEGHISGVFFEGDRLWVSDEFGVDVRKLFEVELEESYRTGWGKVTTDRRRRVASIDPRVGVVGVARLEMLTGEPDYSAWEGFELEEGFTAFSFLSDGRLVVAEESPGRVGVYEHEPSKPRHASWRREPLQGVPPFEIESLATGERGTSAAVGLEDGVVFWPSVDGPPFSVPFDGEVQEIAIAPSDRFVAASSPQKTLVFEVTDMGLSSIGLVLATTGPLAFSRDEKVLFTGDRTINGYDLLTGEPVFRFDTKGSVSALAIDPTGRWLVVGTLGGQVLVAPLDTVDLLDFAAGALDIKEKKTEL